jgi:hypothetical protein
VSMVRGAQEESCLKQTAYIAEKTRAEWTGMKHRQLLARHALYLQSI